MRPTRTASTHVFCHRRDQKPGYRQVSVRIFWPVLGYVFKNSARYRTPSIYKLPWWKRGFFPSSYACFMISFNFFSFFRSSQIKSSDILTSFTSLVLDYLKTLRSIKKLGNDRSRVIWGASPGSPNPMHVLYHGFDAQITRWYGLQFFNTVLIWVLNRRSKSLEYNVPMLKAFRTLGWH